MADGGTGSSVVRQRWRVVEGTLQRRLGMARPVDNFVDKLLMGYAKSLTGEIRNGLADLKTKKERMKSTLSRPSRFSKNGI